jgi:acetoin utilization deacetylase AcuC-like enzyme
VLVDDDLFDKHHAEGLHPERPERLLAARAALAGLGSDNQPRRLAPRDASAEELARAHTSAYLERLDQAAGRCGVFDADTYHSEQSVAAARRAAGGALAMVDELLSGEARLGLALVRPPGHHATAARAMGFCLINHVAVAARHALASGAKRVAIVDWDVHHGNGTQDIFYADPAVLYVSLHQYPFYPGTGGVDELGSGDGHGYTVNLPLSAGATGTVYEAAFERFVVPILEQYGADLILVSAGFDAHHADPLANMLLDGSAYAGMMASLCGLVARGDSQGAAGVGLLLEGGYSLDALRDSLKCTAETASAALFGPPASRPSPSPSPAEPGSSARHEAELARARVVHGSHWALG